MTDDRQTDHATEKCVATGGISCAARAIRLNNNKYHTSSNPNRDL